MIPPPPLPQNAVLLIGFFLICIIIARILPTPRPQSSARPTPRVVPSPTSPQRPTVSPTPSQSSTSFSPLKCKHNKENTRLFLRQLRKNITLKIRDKYDQMVKRKKGWKENKKKNKKIIRKKHVFPQILYFFSLAIIIV